MAERFEQDELVYSGRLIKVHRVGVRTADGQVLQRDLVHYPGAAVILPELHDGSLVFIRNHRFAVGENLYELPAGNLEEGEDPMVCAKRELTEETGYTAGHVRRLGSFYAAPGTSDEKLHAFLATGLRPGSQNLEAYEQIHVEILSQYQVRQLVENGMIHDAKTLATLALYWLKKEVL